MKRVAIALTFLAAVLALSANAAAAQGNLIRQEKFEVSLNGVVVSNPCTEEELELAGTQLFVGHASTDNADGGHHNLHAILVGVTATSLTSGTRYRITLALNEFHNFVDLDPRHTSTATINQKIIGLGATDDFTLHLVSHITINNNGEVTVERRVEQAECRE